MLVEELRGKRCIVIGSGIGGAGIAGLMGVAGAKPIVIERTKYVGGRAASAPFEGCTLDVGVHISPRGDLGELKRLAQLIGAQVEFVNRRHTVRLVCGEHEGVIGQGVTDVLSVFSLARALRPGPWALLDALRLGVRVLRTDTPEKAARYDAMRAATLLRRHVRDPKLRSFLEFMCGVAFVIPVETASAGEFLYTLNVTMRRSAVAYPKGGYGGIAQAYLDVGLRHGGELRLREAVRHIHVEQGRVRAVETNRGRYEADLVVSNAGVCRTMELCGPQHFPASYRARAERARESDGAVLIKYLLDAPVATTPGIFYVPPNYEAARVNEEMRQGKPLHDVAVFAISPTVADPSLAPPGRHLLLACTAAPADMLDRGRNELVLDALERRLHALFPGIERHILARQRQGVGYIAAIAGRPSGAAIGLAQTPGQIGESGFSPETGIKGLYVVGADTASHAVGTERAAKSAVRAFEQICAAARRGDFAELSTGVPENDNADAARGQQAG